MSTLQQQIEEAHKHSLANRKELEQSERCGCFYCLYIFSVSEITEWINDGGLDTAICPKCMVDSVLGSASGYPIEPVFLEAMYQRWFS